MMTAMMIGVVGLSVAASPVAEAAVVNTALAPVKSANIVQQEGEQACTNQAQGQGGQQDVPNADPLASTIQGDPVPDIDVKIGKNPNRGSDGPGISSEGDPIVEAEQSNDCSLAQDLTVEQNAESGDDFSTTDQNLESGDDFSTTELA
jgi:hypothetical protein